jgi:hypothetical protein
MVNGVWGDVFVIAVDGLLFGESEIVNIFCEVGVE